jgi:hypothetical protein
MTNVRLDEHRFGAKPAKFAFQGVALGLAAARYDQAGALLGEGDGGGSADACQGAGDQNGQLAHLAAPRNSIDTGSSRIILSKINHLDF